ncbi:DUF6498-containing protein [Halopelagius longus]|uniref:Uncharacterized protein n=1 Tax=Halopelagius longus TaxID=1236180 RepID=A0A1H1G6Z3_9EURY|nr:DUF6498-containing protein [Halopelagius longus]RDI69813.1 hypothetical protein DWB78_16820 [Halopelagius longus]SDR08809.1 hypothetical protein SAMN05216278_3553 [Halopelagius longus]
MNRTRLSVGQGAGLASVVAVNLVPVVGVAAFGWSLASLLALYWFEAVSTSLVAAAKALFAERASADEGVRLNPLSELREKRGGVRIRPGWPRAYVRNVPFAAGIVSTSTLLLAGYGFALTAELSIRPTDAFSTGVLLSAGGLLLARIVEFRVEYLGRAEYADTSARTIAAAPARQVLFLTLIASIAAVLEGREGGVVLLVGVVAAKTLSESYGFYAEHLDRSPGRVGRWLLGPRDASDPPPTVEMPDDDPRIRVRTDSKAVLLGAFAPLASGLLSRPGYVGAVLAAAGVLALGPAVVAVAVGLLTVVAAAKVGSYYLRYGTVEYQRRGDRIVAYDVALGEPQWAVDADEVDDVSVRNRISDRLLGTTTVELSGVESAGRSALEIGPVDDFHRVAEAFGLPVNDASHPETNRRAVVVALALAACFLAVPAGLFVAPGVAAGTAVAVTFLLSPFVLLVVGALVGEALSLL